MRTVVRLVSFVLMFALGPLAQATTLTFDGLTPGASFTGYSQDGFDVSPESGSWLHLGYGNPDSSIGFSVAGGSTITAAVEVTAGGSAFTFDAVDLYASLSAAPYVFTGFLDSSSVFSISSAPSSVSLAGLFETYANPDSAETIDRLVIALTGPVVCCANQLGLDNIVVSAVPQPATVLLIGPVLGLVAYRRRKKSA